MRSHRFTHPKLYLTPWNDALFTVFLDPPRGDPSKMSSFFDCKVDGYLYRHNLSL